MSLIAGGIYATQYYVKVKRRRDDLDAYLSSQVPST